MFNGWHLTLRSVAVVCSWEGSVALATVCHSPLKAVSGRIHLA